MYKTLKLPGDIVHCDEEIALCYFWLGNGMEALHHAQLAMDFADTAKDDFHKIWAPARMALAKKVLEEFDEALELFADTKSRMVRAENPNWRAVIKLERQVASILVIKGRVSEAQEIDFTLMSPEVTQKVLDRLELLKQPYEKKPDRIPTVRLQELKKPGRTRQHTLRSFRPRLETLCNISRNTCNANRQVLLRM